MSRKHTDNAKLINQIVSQFHFQYELNDKGHQIPHFEDVADCGFKIRNTLGLNCSDESIILVAYFHDLFSVYRANHHQMAKLFVQTTAFEPIANLNQHDRHDIACACGEHRASYKGHFSSVLSELMSSADRGKSDINTFIDRTLYSKIFTDTEEVAISKTYDHIKEKFAKGGYARYPNMYLRVFGDEIATMQDIIACDNDLLEIINMRYSVMSIQYRHLMEPKDDLI